MKNRQFETIEEAEEFKKRMKKDKKRNMTDDEYNARHDHLIKLYGDAIDGDKQAVTQLYMYADSYLNQKKWQSDKHKKAGSKNRNPKRLKVVLLAVAIRREFIKDNWTTYKWIDEIRNDYHLIMQSVEDYIYDVTDENDSIRELIEEAVDSDDILELISNGLIDDEIIREELLDMIRIESIVVQEADRWSAVVEKVIKEAPSHGIEDKRTVIGALEEYKDFIEYKSA